MTCHSEAKDPEKCIQIELTNRSGFFPASHRFDVYPGRNKTILLILEGDGKAGAKRPFS